MQRIHRQSAAIGFACRFLLLPLRIEWGKSAKKSVHFPQQKLPCVDTHMEIYRYMWIRIWKSCLLLYSAADFLCTDLHRKYTIFLSCVYLPLNPVNRPWFRSFPEKHHVLLFMTVLFIWCLGALTPSQHLTFMYIII